MKKVIKNNFRILKKPHAYLQTILKAPVKFQKDRTKTVGGVKGTMYLLKIWNHAPCATHHGKPKTVSLRFSSKRRGTKNFSGIPSECQTVWIQIKVHTVCKGYQQTTKVNKLVWLVTPDKVLCFSAQTIDIFLFSLWLLYLTETV